MASVTLDGITLDLDPQNYIINDGSRRGSTHKLVNGGTIFQDFGFDVTDLRISMKGQLTQIATVQALMASWRKTGHQFHLTDFKGNDLVCIYEPGTKFPLEPIRGSSQGWTYTLNLCVISATSWLSSSFPPTS